MRLVEKEKELNCYLAEWVKSRYENVDSFYKDIHYNGQHWMHQLQNGERLERLVDNIKGNIDEHFCTLEGQSIIPTKFSSIEQLLNTLNRFKDMIKAELPYIEGNCNGENTDYKIINLYSIATDAIHMVDRCNKAYIYDENLRKPYQNLRTLLCQVNINGFLEQLSSVLSSIPARVRKERMNEAYFHIMIHTCLVTIGFDVLSEVSTNVGFIDLAVNLPDNIFIFEFKYSKSSDNLSETALQQIKDKDYCNRFKYHLKPIWGIGVSFGEKQKNINGCQKEIIFHPDQNLVDKILAKKSEL